MELVQKDNLRNYNAIYTTSDKKKRIVSAVYYHPESHHKHVIVHLDGSVVVYHRYDKVETNNANDALFYGVCEVERDLIVSCNYGDYTENVIVTEENYNEMRYHLANNTVGWEVKQYGFWDGVVIDMIVLFSFNLRFMFHKDSNNQPEIRLDDGEYVRNYFCDVDNCHVVTMNSDGSATLKKRFGYNQKNEPKEHKFNSISELLRKNRRTRLAFDYYTKQNTK